MARGAIALGRVVEQAESAQFLRRQRRLAFLPVVVLAAERMEFGVLGLEGGERLAHALQRRLRIVEHVAAIQRSEVAQIGTAFELVDDRRRVGIGHFERGGERLQGLVGQSGGAAVAKKAAIRAAIRIEIECGCERCVHKRGRIAKPGQIHVRAAQRHGRSVIGPRVALVRRERKGGDMARGTGLPARDRQGRVVENLFSQLRRC